MAHAVVVLFDERADTAIRALWRRLASAGVPGQAGGQPPHMVFAQAGSIPARTRAALRAELSTLAIPDLWLSTLGTFPATENVLMLGAVVDGELLAVHSAVHDVLAGRVRDASAYYLPSAWVPHCALATGIEDAQVAAGFAALHPVARIRAAVREIAVVDTRTGERDPLVTR